MQMPGYFLKSEIRLNTIDPNFSLPMMFLHYVEGYPKGRLINMGLGK
jgi:hypothetical protein